MASALYLLYYMESDRGPLITIKHPIYFMLNYVNKTEGASCVKTLSHSNMKQVLNNVDLLHC